LRGSARPGAYPEKLPRGHIDVVLLEPQKSENIGSVARAMANMGLGRLLLVRPRLSKPELMEAVATKRGQAYLGEAMSFPDLESALAPHSLVVGTTARQGDGRGVPRSPRDIAPELLAQDMGRVALVFGTERGGLANPELRLCHRVVTIPTEGPEYSSLNLSQAVLILGYELLLAAGGEPPPPPPVQPAPFEDFQRACRDLEDTLKGVGFLPEENTGRWFMNVKKILNRSLLTRGECDLIQGICRQVRYKAGLGAKKDKKP
jgi:tRNA/rRNA methyltransferase